MLKSGGGELNPPQGVQELHILVMGHRQQLIQKVKVQPMHVEMLTQLNELLTEAQKQNPLLTIEGLLQTVVIYGIEQVSREVKRNKLGPVLKTRR